MSRRAPCSPLQFLSWDSTLNFYYFLGFRISKPSSVLPHLLLLKYPRMLCFGWTSWLTGPVGVCRSPGLFWYLLAVVFPPRPTCQGWIVPGQQEQRSGVGRCVEPSVCNGRSEEWAGRKEEWWRPFMPLHLDLNISSREPWRAFKEGVRDGSNLQLTRVWETSQDIAAVTQKKTNKIVVMFLQKNFKFSLFSFFSFFI